MLLFKHALAVLSIMLLFPSCNEANLAGEQKKNDVQNHDQDGGNAVPESSPGIGNDGGKGEGDEGKGEDSTGSTEGSGNGHETDSSDDGTETVDVDATDGPDTTATATPTPNPTATETSVVPAGIVTCTPQKFNLLAPSVPATVYDISSASEFAGMKEGRRYRLTTDIVLTGFWTPLLRMRNLYLNGNGHTVSGLHVDTVTNANGLGYVQAGALFSELKNSVISNIKFASPVISSRNNAAVIAGTIQFSCLEKIEISHAEINGVYQVGVIGGNITNGVEVENLKADVIILHGPDAKNRQTQIGAAGEIGGLAGMIQNMGPETTSFKNIDLTYGMTLDGSAGASGFGGLFGMVQKAVIVTNVTAKGSMRCNNGSCLMAGRIRGFKTTTSPEVDLRESSILVNQYGSWTDFQD